MATDVVSTHLKNMSQIGNHPQVGVNLTNIFELPPASENIFQVAPPGKGWSPRLHRMEHQVFFRILKSGILRENPVTPLEHTHTHTHP